MNDSNASRLPDGYDVYVIHDPQPAAVRHFSSARGARWVWRSHIDTTAPNPAAWAYLRPFVEEYDAVVFTSVDFVPREAHLKLVTCIPLAIDAFHPINTPMSDDEVRNLLAGRAIAPDRPLIGQFSRFDTWRILWACFRCTG